MNSPTVTVLMPVYNCAEFVGQAIKSILAQTYRDFELLIINDGSTDNTEQEILAFPDRRIVYVRHELNRGLVESLNHGLSLARGRLIARMDADDISLSTRLATQVRSFENNPGLVVCGSNYYKINAGLSFYRSHSLKSDSLKTILLFATCFSHPTVMIRNIFGRHSILYNKHFLHAEDYKMWTDLAFYGEFEFINKPLLRYRIHQSQVSVQFKTQQESISGEIREEYLRRTGFTFTSRELYVHNILGNNSRISDLKMLVEIETWLINLVRQNESLNRFDPDAFKFVIRKYWLECCGNTTLGIKAYVLGIQSTITGYKRVTLKERTSLIVKCLVRR